MYYAWHMPRYYALHISIAKRDADTAFVFEAEQWWQAQQAVVVVTLLARPLPMIHVSRARSESQ
jgi:hypothetical protein